MFGWLCVTLGIAFGSALLPLISIEIFVIGLVTQQPNMPWLAIGAAVAIGQVAGKLLYFLAARGSLRLPHFLHKRLEQTSKPTVAQPETRWRVAFQWLREKTSTLLERCRQHPYWMTGTYAFSSLIGLPPFMVMTVLAGLVRMRLSVFLLTGVVGRFIRFSILAAAPAVFTQWLTW